MRGEMPRRGNPTKGRNMTGKERKSFFLLLHISLLRISSPSHLGSFHHACTIPPPHCQRSSAPSNRQKAIRRKQNTWCPCDTGKAFHISNIRFYSDCHLKVSDGLLTGSLSLTGVYSFHRLRCPMLCLWVYYDQSIV